MEVEPDVLKFFVRDEEVRGRTPAVEVEKSLTPRCDDVDKGSVISPPHRSDADGDARMGCRAAVRENVTRSGREERLVGAVPCDPSVGPFERGPSEHAGDDDSAAQLFRQRGVFGICAASDSADTVSRA